MAYNNKHFLFWFLCVRNLGVTHLGGSRPLTRVSVGRRPQIQCSCWSEASVPGQAGQLSSRHGNWLPLEWMISERGSKMEPEEPLAPALGSSILSLLLYSKFSPNQEKSDEALPRERWNIEECGHTSEPLESHFPASVTLPVKYKLFTPTRGPNSWPMPTCWVSVLHLPSGPPFFNHFWSYFIP